MIGCITAQNKRNSDTMDKEMKQQLASGMYLYLIYEEMIIAKINVLTFLFFYFVLFR